MDLLRTSAGGGTVCGTIVLSLCISLVGYGRQLQRSQWGAPSFSVTHSNGNWVIAGRKNTVTINESDLSIKVQAGPASWSMMPSARGAMLVRAPGEDFALRLADARQIAVTRFDTGFKTGVKIKLGNWQHDGYGVALDLTLTLTLCLEGKDEEVVFEAAAAE